MRGTAATWGLGVGVSGAGGEAECGGWYGGSFPRGWWPPSTSSCCLLGLGWELEGTRGGLGLKLPAKHLDEENQDAEILQKPFFVIFFVILPLLFPEHPIYPSLSSQLGGGALLGVGIWVTVDGQSFVKIFGGISSTVLQVVNVGYFLIVIGAILLIIGFLGCYGAQKESKCLLMMVRTGP